MQKTSRKLRKYQCFKRVRVYSSYKNLSENIQKYASKNLVKTPCVLWAICPQFGVDFAPLWDPFGTLLGPFWDLLGPLGRLLGSPGRLLDALGTLLDALGALLGASWTLLGHS